MALVASVVIGILLFLKEKHKLFWYLMAGFSGVSAIIASALMWFQVSVGYSLCWACFVSGSMFYLIFLFFIICNISPWLKEKWRQI
jgi:uncharacterized membrane protein